MTKRILLVLFLLWLEAAIRANAFGTYTVFMGNPNLGKSTLLNSIVGKLVFKSHLSPKNDSSSDALTVRKSFEEKT
jgi:ribosome biogenesis GTPase A